MKEYFNLKQNENVHFKMLMWTTNIHLEMKWEGGNFSVKTVIFMKERGKKGRNISFN